MHFSLLAKVIAELSPLITDARVERVFQGQDNGLYFALRRGGVTSFVLIAPHRSLPRIHLATRKPQASSLPHPFALVLRSRLQGSRVRSISLLNQDRIVELRFQTSSAEERLIFELTGPSTNLFFVGPDQRIIGSYYPVTPAEGSARTLLPGAAYVPPPKKTTFTADQDVPGVNPALSPNAAAADLYERIAEERRIAALKSEVLSALHRALKKAERKEQALTMDLRSAERADEFKQAGELILAHLRELRGGMDKAKLTGYDGISVVISLDPKLAPARNAEQYFKKYKKARAGQQIVALRLRDAAEEVASLQAMLREAEEGTDAALKEIRSRLVDRGYLRMPTGLRDKAVPPRKTPGYRAVVFHGWEILVGTSASGNDHITTKIARPDDLWLHAEGMPGSHVLVRNARKGAVPPDVLMKAAALAAFYSKGRHADKVPVTYTRAGLVKKPKGAKPGLVVLSERKTLMARPEDAAGE